MIFQRTPRNPVHLFRGKGGVGKTVVAAAVALWMAKQGKRPAGLDQSRPQPLQSLPAGCLRKARVDPRHGQPPRSGNRHQGHDRQIQDRRYERRSVVSQICGHLRRPKIHRIRHHESAFEESCCFENGINIILTTPLSSMSSTPHPRRTPETAGDVQAYTSWTR